MNKPTVLLPILAIASLNASCDAYIVTKPTALIARRCLRTAVTKPSSSALQSSTGGNERPPPPEGGDGDSNSQWDDFFREESENLQKAREYMSENALPLSYDGPNNDNDELSANETKERQPQDEESSSLVRSEFFQGEPNPEDLANNPYLQVVSRLSPSELISKFTSSAHPRVQNAVRSTILSLIGGLPKMMFDVTTVTTGQRLASLMFQLQVSTFAAKVGYGTEGGRGACLADKQTKNLTKWTCYNVKNKRLRAIPSRMRNTASVWNNLWVVLVRIQKI